MSAATLVNDFARDFRPPPAVDWATFLIGDDLKHLEKMVDRFEKDAIDWRAMLQSRIVPLLDSVKAADAGKDNQGGEKTAKEALAVLVKSLNESIARFGRPMHERPDVAAKLAQLPKLSPDAGRFVRKLMRRIERVRVALHATCVDAYYGILAVQSELDKDTQPQESFTDPDALGKFLRQSIA